MGGRMGGKDNEGREALAAELKEKRGATLLRDLHSCSRSITVT